ncbi:hypothetical protein MPTK1_7g17100 [Marchantia polymorpha subsp. ruderalis]|nr:hypothetical protein Mp_7g17100 [Marchantia polymorpha subsp. ruderalis]
MIQQLETTLKHNQAPAMAQQLGNNQALPNFSGVHVPTSVGVSMKSASSGSTLPSSTPSCTTSTEKTSTRAESTTNIATPNVVDSKKAEEHKDKSVAADDKQDTLVDARAKVQEEITREFMVLMASGSLRASEAAALAARRVMERHGIGSGVATN